MPISLGSLIYAWAILAPFLAVGVFIGWKWGWMKGGAYFVLVCAAIIGAAVLREAGYFGW